MLAHQPAFHMEVLAGGAPKRGTSPNILPGIPDALGAPQAGSQPRLLVLPASAFPLAAGHGGHRRILDHAAEVGIRRMAAFLAEAAVLVLVLGLLERLLAVHRVEWLWALTVVGLSAALLAGSIALEVLDRHRAAIDAWNPTDRPPPLE